MFGQIIDGRPIRGLASHYRRDSNFRENVNSTVSGGVRGAMRYDADTGNAFFLRELESIDQRLFEKKYAELPYLSLLPLIPNIGPATEIYTWRHFDRRARAHWGMPDSGASVPKANIAMAPEETSYIRSMVSGFGFSILEMRAAAQVGRPLEIQRAEAARRAISELQNYTALNGETEFGMYGLFNIPNVQTITPSVDGSARTAWIGSDKTSQQIVNDMVNLCNQVEVNSKGVHKVTRLLLPHAEYLFIEAQPYAPGAGFYTNKTILQRFQEVKPGVQVMYVLGLDTASSTGGNRMIGYDPSSDNLGLVLPIPFELFAPFATGTSYDTICHARMGEVVVYYIDSMIYSDGI